MGKKKDKKKGGLDLVWLITLPVLVLISILLFLTIWDGFEKKAVDLSHKFDISIDKEILEPLTPEDYSNLLGD